jgi:hypothetical protein
MYYASIFQSYPDYSSNLEFGHPGILERFFVTRFSEEILLYVLFVCVFVVVALIDLILAFFKGKVMLKYAAITLLGEMTFIFMML